eukprot:986829_1
MFIHPKYTFVAVSANHNNFNAPPPPPEHDKHDYWKDVFTFAQNVNDSTTNNTANHNESIPININSTLNAIRKYVKAHKLGIKCSGKGRTKAVILKDIQHMMSAKKQISEKNANEDEIKDDSNHNSNSKSNHPQNQSMLFPMPFQSFSKCCIPSSFTNAEFDKTKLDFQWISGSIQDIKQDITAISLLLSWQNRWIFEVKYIEAQFFKCFECTQHKLDK